MELCVSIEQAFTFHHVVLALLVEKPAIPIKDWYDMLENYLSFETKTMFLLTCEVVREGVLNFFLELCTSEPI